MQIQLTGFLDKDTASFCRELWRLFLSAQTNSQGVPKELLEAKKQELIQEKVWWKEASGCGLGSIAELTLTSWTPKEPPKTLADAAKIWTLETAN